MKQKEKTREKESKKRRKVKKEYIIIIKKEVEKRKKKHTILTKGQNMPSVAHTYAPVYGNELPYPCITLICLF